MNQKYKDKTRKIGFSRLLHIKGSRPHPDYTHTSQNRVAQHKKSNSLKIKTLIKFKIEGKGGAINR